MAYDFDGVIDRRPTESNKWHKYPADVLPLRMTRAADGRYAIDGRTFGKGGQGFVRLNFACPRATLTEALERKRRALEQRG